MSPPTEKQITAAGYISKNLNIPLPKEFSEMAYWNYINRYMDKSKEAYRQKFRWRRHSRASSTSTRSFNESRLRKQRQADWEATHLDSTCHATRVLDGEVGAPSWWHGDTPSFQRHLRSLGFRSSSEEREQLRRNQEFGGLEGPPEWW